VDLSCALDLVAQSFDLAFGHFRIPETARMRRTMDYLNTLRMAVWFWVKNILLGFDQLFNAILAGDPDETLSRRAGRARDRRQMWGCRLCSWLDLIDPRHCQKTLDRIGVEEGENSVPRLLSRWRIERHMRGISDIAEQEAYHEDF
jgi:hypothetical protein